MTSVREALSRMREQFSAAGIDSAEADARILAQHALGMTREELFLNSDGLLSDSEVNLLDSYVARRLKREPVSRITGARAFWKSDFRIGPETLDPRPDSETLIEAALKHVPSPSGGGGGLRVLDLGTGSGCLLLSLLQEWPEAKGVGIDISQGAVELAESNARALGLADRAKFLCGDWKGMAPDGRFDVIISNPPYISEEEVETLEPEVALHDPRRALVAGEGGLACYREITGLLRGLLAPGGYAFFEIGHTQGRAVKDLLEQAGFAVLETAQDLAGSDRCIVARQHKAL